MSEHRILEINECSNRITDLLQELKNGIDEFGYLIVHASLHRKQILALDLEYRKLVVLLNR